MRAPQGAQGRVAATHAQTRRSLGVTVAFVLAAALVAIVDRERGTWAALHLFLVGALLSAISTATQFLAVTWSAAPAPSDRLAAAQRWSLALGAAGLVLARRLDAPPWVPAAFGCAVVAGLGLLALSLLEIRAGAAVDRFHPAIDAYLIAVSCGAVGASIGVVMVSGWSADHHDRLRDAHLTLNLFGLVATVIAATLPYMAATQLRTKMSPRATPGGVWAVVTGMSAANLVVVAGSLLDDDRLRAAGLLVHAITVVALLRLLPRPGRRQFDRAGPRLVQLLTGIGWWAIATGLLARAALVGADPAPARTALVLGGFAQILTASLAYLAPVVRGGGHRRLSAGFATTRSWVAPVAGNVAALAALAEARAVLGAAIAVWAIDLAVRGALLLRTPTE